MTTIHRLLRRRLTITGGTTIQNPSTTTTTKTLNSMLRHQTTATTNTINSRTYSKLPPFFRKSRDFCNSNDFSSSSSFLTSPFSSSTSSASNITASFVGWYLGMIKSRPILTKSVTCSLIYVAADLSSQTIVRQDSEPYDLARTLRMGGFGLLILGPTVHFWFNFVSRRFPKRDIITTFKKIILGQTIYGPTLNAIFFSMNAFLQGENGSEIVERLKRDLLPTMMNGIMYWPLCDFITFKFVPVHLQPLVSNSFSYLWTIYITYMASREKVGNSS